MEFDKRLIELESLVSRKQSFMRKLDEANKELSVYKFKKARLIEEFKKTNTSITKLDNNSIVDLWLATLNDNKDKLSKNEQDYKLIIILIDSINKEISDLHEKLEPIYKYDEEYCELLKQQKDYSNTEINKIREINKQINQYKVNIKDLNDVILIGNHLNTIFNYINENLEKSKKWKAFDIFGKGILANLTKNSYVKEAEEKVNQIHYLAQRFARELLILDTNLGIHINIKELNEFSSYFFDQLYYDMTDNKRLTNIFDFIKKGNKYITDTLNYLSLFKEDYIQKIINLDNSKR
ncbi:MAG: hypothetical protein K0Q49_2410 [Haloplasmataceae bacterium]|nr:hypothetical protein [Haloplasmataceae bacterium]